MTAFQSALFDSDGAEAVEPKLTIEREQPTNELASFDMISRVIGQYRQSEQAIMRTAEVISEARKFGVMNYFIDGLRLVHSGQVSYVMPTDTSAALAVLRSEYWMRLINQAEIFEAMPANKREAARKTFSGLDCPPFDESTVRATMEDLLRQRSTFFAERVDNIFRSLSKEHVTNRPEGFSKRLIIANYQYQMGVLNDLRGVVGRLSGRGEPREYDTERLFRRIACYPGKKVSIDGGAFHVKVFMCGTAHFELAPDLAISLNSILAALYPLAIPSEFRTHKKSKAAKSYDLKQERLSMGVLSVLTNLELRGQNNGRAYVGSLDKVDVQKAVEILEGIGGKIMFNQSRSDFWADFDYAPHSVIEQIIFTGAVPEQVSYQFYPTKSEIGAVAASLIDVKPNGKYLEPSAGNGDLAAQLPVPQESVTCIEIAPVRVRVLRAKGFNTVEADFLTWAAQNSSDRFDAVLLNPPFSKGRALAHLQAASTLVDAGGQVVAILPASMVNTTPLEGFSHEWSEVYVDQFEGTAVRVVILNASKQN